MKTSRVVPALVIVAILSLCSWSSAIGMSAQTGTVTEGASPIVGSWSLNRELSATTPSPEVGGRRGGRRGDGAGVGGGGFGGGFGGGRGGRGQGRGEARADGERAVALVQELITPPTKWLIVREAGETLAFTNADGRTVRYAPNNRTEKHQLINGTIETRSKWDHGEFRQEISAPGALDMVRTFASDASTHQLIMTTTFDGETAGRDRRPFRVVYDRDEE